MKNFNRWIGVLGLIFLSVGCSKKNDTPPPAPPVKAESVEPAASPQPLLNEKLTQALDEIQRLKKKVDEQEQSLKKANLVMSLQTPSQKIVVELAEQKTVPFLIDAHGAPASQLKGLENAIRATDTKSTFKSHIYSDKGGAENYGRFFITTDSLDRARGLFKYIRESAPDLKVYIIEAQETFPRAYMQITYNQRNIFRVQTFSKVFWVGDLSLIDSETLARGANNFANLNPTFSSDCDAVSSHCLSHLVDQGYLKKPTVIDGKSQLPLDFLAREIKSTLNVINGGGSASFNPFAAVIRNIKIVNVLWVRSPDTSLVTDISRFSNFFGSPAAERSGDQAAYELPVFYETRLPAITADPKLNLIVGLTKLREYLCSVGSCSHED